MTVVLDTNVLISALIHPGSARFLILKKWRHTKIITITQCQKLLTA